MLGSLGAAEGFPGFFAVALARDRGPGLIACEAASGRRRTCRFYVSMDLDEPHL